MKIKETKFKVILENKDATKDSYAMCYSKKRIRLAAKTLGIKLSSKKVVEGAKLLILTNSYPKEIVKN